jgi:hypothetical protein
MPPGVLNAPSGTISAWLDSSEATTSGQNFGTGLQADSSKEFHFTQWSTYYGGTIFGWNSGTDYTINLPSTTLNLPANTWEYLTYTWDQPSNTQVIYLNGIAVDTVTTAFTPYTPVNNFWLGTDPENQGYAFGGIMDEVRFSNIARSAGWIATTYATQNSPSTFAALGSESSN